jgi:hypothetical protein
MSSYWKIVFLIPLFVISACTQKAASTDGEEAISDISSESPSQGVIAEENTNQGKPVLTLTPVDTTVEIATFPIDLEPAHLDHAKLIHQDWNTFSSSKQLEKIQEIRDAWQQEMGELNPGTMKLTAVNLNKFFQFVRVAGGDKFLIQNEYSAILNHQAHSELDKILEENDAAALASFTQSLSHQTNVNIGLRQRILGVAKLYSIGIEAAVPSLEERENFSEDLGDEIKDALNLSVQQTAGVKMRLVDLLRSTLFMLQGTEKNVCFLSFTLADDQVAIPGLDRHQVLDRLYGATRAVTNGFVSRND